MAIRVQPPEAAAVVPLPSADLINYRFDQTDGKFAEISRKIDKISGSFVTKEESFMKRQEYEHRFDEQDKRHEAVLGVVTELKSANDQLKGSVTAIKLLIGALTGIAAIVGSLWWLHP
jgi:hypothetical protein